MCPLPYCHCRAAFIIAVCRIRIPHMSPCACGHISYICHTQCVALCIVASISAMAKAWACRGNIRLQQRRTTSRTRTLSDGGRQLSPTTSCLQDHLALRASLSTSTHLSNLQHVPSNLTLTQIRSKTTPVPDLRLAAGLSFC